MGGAAGGAPNKRAHKPSPSLSPSPSPPRSPSPALRGVAACGIHVRGTAGLRALSLSRSPAPPSSPRP
eukprot:5668000-Alexandrium_andersonii.AAC.1